MSVFRMQDNVPSVYVEQSRDFQLFCRLYDCVINGLLFDIQTMPDVLDTDLCRSSFLKLLQTKLGFFTQKSYQDSTLRYVLKCFPRLLANKGSIQSIREAVNIFLKVCNIRTSITVYYGADETTLDNSVTVPAHSLIIGLGSSFEDASILDDLFRYILPAGVGYHLYFSNSMEELANIMEKNDAKLLFVSHNIASQVRGSDQEYSDDFSNRVIGSIDTIIPVSSDSTIPHDIYDTFTITKLEDGTYTGEFVNLDASTTETSITLSELSDINQFNVVNRVGEASIRRSLFLGVYNEMPTDDEIKIKFNISQEVLNSCEYIIVITSADEVYKDCIISKEYVRNGNSWVEFIVNYKGKYLSKPETTGYAENDLIFVKNSTERRYYILSDGEWKVTDNVTVYDKYVYPKEKRDEN